MEQTTPSKLRTLYPAKLYPPIEVIKKMREKEKAYLPNNPILRFFHIFFGEGF